MTYDPNVPDNLKKTQYWFGNTITIPLIDHDKMATRSRNGKKIREEAREYIAPSPTLKPHERIEIYNQQYWWRLYTTLQDTCPLVTRLFGLNDFNTSIAIPYLSAYPPNSWSLNVLANNLPRWLRESYHAKDRQIVIDAADIDVTFNLVFVTGKKTPLSLENTSNEKEMEELLEKKLYLQPHVHLFKHPYDLFTLREEMLKQEPDYWVHHDFPQLARDKEYRYMVYQNYLYNVAWSPITYPEHVLLSLFQKGCSISDACDALEQEGPEVYEQASQNLMKWFQKWAGLKLLTLETTHHP
jgi:hypothetical protein